MSNESLVNQSRLFHFILGVLENQQRDPNCRVCLSFAKNTEAVKQRFVEFEKSCSSAKEGVPDKFREQLAGLHARSGPIQEPGNPVGQRKTGNCSFHEKLCIVQESMAIFERLQS